MNNSYNIEINLIKMLLPSSSAAKFTPEGKIRIELCHVTAHGLFRSIFSGCMNSFGESFLQSLVLLGEL